MNAMFDKKVTDIMFEKTLTDVVKGIRGSKRDTALYISKCIAEIKQELNSTDLYVKSNALNKLTFLQMMGYGMSYASFPTIEVMSSPRFAHKRIGYLAACQGFNQNTEVILLTTNLLQKELRRADGGMGMYETGLAINCISNIVTEELARDVLPELTNLTSHQQPYLRKKAVLCLFKLFMKYPLALRLTFDKIQQSLEDTNPGVVSCAVNVITELSDKNAKNYLHLAPAFFQLLTQSQNNWMLIKVVKLLGSLVPEEPRLARKLLEPLAAMVQSTQAKSLLYEAVYTITLCLPYCRKADGSMPAAVPAIVQLCGKTLKEFCADKDQNLKYLGLVGFSSLRQSHPKCLMESDARPLILGCLSDEDVTIRRRALGLLPGMTSRKNLQELIAQLMSHVEAASGDYRKDLVLKLIELCSSEKYALLQDFSWYLDILLQLSYFDLTDDLGELLAQQITDVALRVLPVRPYAVKECSEVLIVSSSSLSGKPNANNKMVPQVLPAAAWIVGEYADLLEEGGRNYVNLINSLTHSSNIGQLLTPTQSIYLQASLKIFAAATNKAKDEELEQCIEILTNSMPLYMQSLDVEVQERAFTGLELLRSLNLLSGLPQLTTTTIDDGVELDDDADNAEDNILGMMDSPKPTLVKKSKRMISTGNLSSRFRSTSATLNFLFKPDPMKPVSAKAQRKKFQAPLGGIDFDWLTAPLDPTVFSYLDNTCSDPKPIMEQVSFTQQRFYKVQPPPATVTSLSGFGGGGMMDMPKSLPISFAENISGENSGMMIMNNRPQDPFYLDAGSSKASTVDESSEGGGRFGTIQLLDSGDEEDNRHNKRCKKKEKKRKKQHSSSPIALALNTVAQATTITTTASLEVYKSDDDDDDDDYLLSVNRPMKSLMSKDFAGLASVDLTKPIGEHEISLPNREHRQVPERTTTLFNTKANKKKKKKESKRKVKEVSPSTAVGTASSGVADLLDFTGFSYVADVSNPAIPGVTDGSESGLNNLVDTTASSTTVMANEAIPTTVASALDDLLGLEAASGQSVTFADAAADPLGSIDISMTSTTAASSPPPNDNIIGEKNRQKTWMRATVKSAAGNGSQINWSQVSMFYKITSTDNPSGVVTMTVRIQNNMPLVPLNNLSLNIKNNGGQFYLGSIGVNSSKETKNIGPFQLEQIDSSVELKAKLSSSSSDDNNKICTVPVKIILPASLHCTPMPGLTLDGVMQELSSQQFVSTNSKVELSNTVDSIKVKALLTSFFRAAPVEDSWILAAKSLKGAKVRVLLKMKGTSAVKIDIKCTDAALCKALGSDVKKLVL